MLKEIQIKPPSPPPNRLFKTTFLGGERETKESIERRRQ